MIEGAVNRDILRNINFTFHEEYKKFLKEYETLCNKYGFCFILGPNVMVDIYIDGVPKIMGRPSHELLDHLIQKEIGDVSEN